MLFHLFQDNHAGFYMYITANYQFLLSAHTEARVKRWWYNKRLNTTLSLCSEGLGFRCQMGMDDQKLDLGEVNCTFLEEG